MQTLAALLQLDKNLPLSGDVAWKTFLARPSMTDKIAIDEQIFVTVFSVLCLMSRMGLTIKIN